MWMKINSNLTNIEQDKWYKTSLFHNGEYHVIQVMKFYRGLWWTSDGMYTYYSPSHIWKD